MSILINMIIDAQAEAIGEQSLHKNAVGLSGELFMTVANAAPITAMLDKATIAVGTGNGLYVPVGYVVATFFLALFALNDTQMTKYITAILVTMGILIVQALCAFAVIAFLHLQLPSRTRAHWFKTFAAPLVRGLCSLWLGERPALYFKASDARKYRIIDRIVMDEERA